MMRYIVTPAAGSAAKFFINSLEMEMSAEVSSEVLSEPAKRAVGSVIRTGLCLLVTLVFWALGGGRQGLDSESPVTLIAMFVALVGLYFFAQSIYRYIGLYRQPALTHIDAERTVKWAAAALIFTVAYVAEGMAMISLTSAGQEEFTSALIELILFIPASVFFVCYIVRTIFLRLPKT